MLDNTDLRFINSFFNKFISDFEIYNNGTLEEILVFNELKRINKKINNILEVK